MNTHCAWCDQETGVTHDGSHGICKEHAEQMLEEAKAAKAVFIKGDGTIEAIGETPFELQEVGTPERKRASHIVPLHRGKRFAFMALRTIFGERGITAEWTRQWSGPWLAVIIETGEFYVHQSRRVCLRWERERLEALYERR